jgi:hypothetical protein
MVPPAGNRYGCLQRLKGVRRRRLVASFHGAESTAPGAGVAEEHDSGGGDAVPFPASPSAPVPALQAQNRAKLFRILTSNHDALGENLIEHFDKLDL